MATLVLDTPVSTRPKTSGKLPHAEGWLVFQYVPVGLFSLKPSRATSTAGKTLLVPTPYAVKMAFLDAALRNDLVEDPEDLVKSLAAAVVRIGVPEQVCVTGTIQSVRQETREAERKRNPKSPPYRSTIAMREFAHCEGTLRLAFDLRSCRRELQGVLMQTAPAINYLGKRASFIQYLGAVRLAELDHTFTMVTDQQQTRSDTIGQHATLDDFGSKASFEALNSFTPTAVKIGVHRTYIDTIVPLVVYNAGAGFVHYRKPPRLEGD